MKSTIHAKDLRIGDKLPDGGTVTEIAIEGDTVMVQCAEDTKLREYRKPEPLFIYREHYGK